MKSPYRNNNFLLYKNFIFYAQKFFIKFLCGKISLYFYSAKYNRTERLCIILYDGSGLLRELLPRCMFCYIIIKDATIRPVLKHGPRSSTGLRVVEFNTKLNYIRGEAKAKLCDVCCNRHTAARADYGYA